MIRSRPTTRTYISRNTVKMAPANIIKNATPGMVCVVFLYNAINETTPIVALMLFMNDVIPFKAPV